MRADRLLSIVLLLQKYHRLTARSLAARLEVSERTVHRDMEALSSAGIPVVAERGIGGGWSLIGEYRTTLTGLTEAEIRSLFVSKPTKLLADLKLDQAAENALLKLSAALPERHREGAERARQRIHVDSLGWSQRAESVPLLPLLQEAVWSDHKLRFTYDRGPECKAADRTVDPLGLVAKGQAWYLVASVAGQLRTYRVSRIIAAEILNERVSVPLDFDLAAYWEESAASFRAHLPSYTATFSVAPEVFPRLRLAGRFARVKEPTDTDARGWLTVTVGFDVEEMACEWALGFGTRIEILGPETLRDKVVAAAREVVDFYSNQRSSVKATHN
jgi:predicted DNA-binding transcriptional regulator YafY